MLLVVRVLMTVYMHIADSLHRQYPRQSWPSIVSNLYSMYSTALRYVEPINTRRAASGK